MDQLRSRLYKGLDVLLPLANRVGTHLYVENIPFAFLPDADGLMRALDDYGAEDIGIVYDIANAVFIKEDLAAGFRRVRERLRLVHLSDTGHRIYRHDSIGRGVVPFTTVPPMLREVGYAELPMLEIISPAADADIRHSADQLIAMGWGEEKPASRSTAAVDRLGQS
jgi:L-ribulose-5-phosphate 3-epimerase